MVLDIPHTRIAPTPSGHLHLGNAINFMITWALTRSIDGKVSLRIDDLDAPRIRDHYIEDIFKGIEWLGIDIDAGPSGPTEHEEKYSQQLRLEKYQQTIQELIDRNMGVFACKCSRAQIRQISIDGQYAGTCRERKIPYDVPESALRIITPKDEIIVWEDLALGKISIELYQKMRDFVIRRKDGFPAYQIGSIIDDTEFGVNFIVRGADLQESTAAQLFLAKKLENKFFQKTYFFHHPLILGENGQKLSKSNRDTGIKTWYEANKSPRKIYQLAANTLGIQNKHISTPNDLVNAIREAEILPQPFS